MTRLELRDRRLGLRDRARIAWTVWNMHLQLADLPGRRRREIVRELRANLRAAAGEFGGREAVARLGSRKELANGYLAAAGPRSRWKIGLAWIAVTWSTWVLLLVLLEIGFMVGVDAAAPAGDHSYSWRAPWLLGFGGEADVADGQLLGLGLEVRAPGPLVVGLAAFALGSSRFWRMLPSVRPAPWHSRGRPE